MGPEFLSLLMFLVTCGVLLLGFPVAFSLAGTALIFAGIGTLFGVFDLPLLGGLGSRYFGVMVNQVLVAVPLFVFMGVMLERSKVAEKLLETMGLLFGSVRGGLGLSVIFVGMLLAASTGIVGAAVVTMGLLSLPTMMKAGYDPKLACGIICASGTLGQIIPPSIVLVLLASILQGANTKAQLALGNFAPEPVSVVDLFAGAFIPGLLLVVLYMAWVLFVAATRPDAPNVEWRQADALALPFADGEFDVVVCQFSVMFFPDRVAAYREALRVLGPGGSFFFNVWDRIEENEIPMAVSDAVAELFPGDPPQFLRRTPHGYHDTEAITSELQEAGFARVEFETVEHRSRASSPDDPAIGFCQGTPLRNEIEARDASRLGEATEAASQAVRRRFGDGPIEGKIQAHVFSATAWMRSKR